jgi:hypothetical protein
MANVVADQKERKPNANKRYSKCGYWWSSKHLKSFFTFVLAGFEQQFNPALAIELAVGS